MGAYENSSSQRIADHQEYWYQSPLKQISKRVCEPTSQEKERKIQHVVEKKQRVYHQRWTCKVKGKKALVEAGGERDF